MSYFTRSRSTSLVLLFLLFSRLIANALIPINDMTEARYAEIARKMLETGNWITPMIDYGTPFLAKPPLSFWLSALSMKILGVNAFAARFPSVLFSLGTLGLIWILAKVRFNIQIAWISVLVLSSCVFFFIDAGAVMTDPALLFSLTLTMVSFWLAVVEKRVIWGYLFYVGLGLGLLAKGLLAILFPGIAIFIWTLIYKQWRLLWSSLPWIKGTLLMLLIALPWYLIEEAKQPGFLHYFIIGEHFGRFINPGWQGDKYGYVHAVPHGMIWIYALGGIFPWMIPIIDGLIKPKKERVKLSPLRSNWATFCILWLTIPLLFFTVASNIIYPYTMPCLPSFALLFASVVATINLTPKQFKQLHMLASITGLVFLVVTTIFIIKPEWVAKSQNAVIEAWFNQHPARQSKLIYWNYDLINSAQFYSGGRTVATVKKSALCHIIALQKENYIVLDSDVTVPLPVSIKNHLIEIISIHQRKKQITLYRIVNNDCKSLM